MNVIIWSMYLTVFWRNYFDMHPVDLEFFHFVCFLVGENFGCVSVNFEPYCAFCNFLKSVIILLRCFKEVAIMITSAKRK